MSGNNTPHFAAGTSGERCLACQSTRFVEWFTKISSDDGLPYPIFKCGECYSAFVSPRPTVEYLEDWYSGRASSHSRNLTPFSESESYERVLQDERDYPNAVLDSERIASYCKRLARGTKFLDIGAGYGFFSRAALQQGFQVSAIEPTKVCRDVIRLMCGVEAKPGMLTRDFARANAGSFDVVLMSQVLEHIADLEAAVSEILELLSPNGIAAIAVPHFGSWLSIAQGQQDMFIVPPEHLNVFSRIGIKALFARYQFSCCGLHTVSRINTIRVQQRLAIPIVGRGASECVRIGLGLSDHFQRGMFINAYFRKMI